GAWLKHQLGVTRTRNGFGWEFLPPVPRREGLPARAWALRPQLTARLVLLRRRHRLRSVHQRSVLENRDQSRSHPPGVVRDSRAGRIELQCAAGSTCPRRPTTAPLRPWGIRKFCFEAIDREPRSRL